MAALNFRRRRTRRGWYAGATLAVAVFFAVFYVVGASANLSGSTFEGGDGNLAVNTAGNTDWANVAGLNTGIDKPPGSTDNSFGQGTKEDNSAVTVVSGSIPPNKNDLTRFYEASEQASGGHIFLYLAWERLVNIGNANLDFEINQNPTAGFTANTTGAVNLNRTAGDLLVTYDFGGSGTPTLGLNTWLTAAAGNTVAQCFSANALPCWGKHVTLNSGNSEGAVNTIATTDPLQNPAASEGVGLFGEAAIDLTAAGIFPPGVCEAFGSTFLKSRSSSSFTAEIKDFIAPVAVNVSNCGSITIHKVTENGDSSFGYTTTGGLSPSTFNLTNGGTQSYPKVNAGGYSVSENLTAAQVAAGWTLKSLTCNATGTGTSATPSGSTVNITEALGGVVDCTYTNHINLSPSITTTLSATTANIGDQVHDSASLSGATANAGGTVTYHAYAGANHCSGTDLLNSTVNVNNGQVPDSASISFNTAGSYSFQAVYSGDGNNNPATSVCSTEQLLVKTNPGITTQLSASTAVNIGDQVTDSATLTGATADAGGSVTYHAYAGANTCTGSDLLNSTKPVNNGTVAASAPISFANAGYYSFQAVYSGDGKNNGATSDCSTEQLLVKTNPTISTQLSAPTVDVGDPVTDSATLHGATADAIGSVTYHAYAGTTCSGPDLLNSTKQVTNGTVGPSDSISFNTAGNYSFQAVYSGDSKNNGATSVCSTEQLLVKAKPTISTLLSATSIEVGSSASDSATLSGATGDAGGFVTYTVYPNSSCLTGGRDAGTVPVNNGNVPNSNLLEFDLVGTYYWQATYTGDPKNEPTMSVCTEEQLVVTPKHPGASTAQNLIPNDSFTLTGGFNPLGHITFNLFSPSDASCSGTPALTQQVNVNGNGTYPTTNTTFIASAEGTWRWQSSYSGDTNNTSAVSSCGTEQFTIANH